MNRKPITKFLIAKDEEITPILLHWSSLVLIGNGVNCHFWSSFFLSGR